jgi:hypothetical protein
MAERNWLLNDSFPLSLAQEFETPVAEGSWTLNDSFPVSLAQTFAAPAAEWSGTYWGPFELAFNAVEVAGDVTGTIAAATAADLGAASGLVTVAGSIAGILAHDTAIASGSVIVTGTIATTEARDIAFAVGMVGTVQPPADTLEYHGGGKKRHEDDYEIVIKQWELLELRRRAQTENRARVAEPGSPAATEASAGGDDGPVHTPGVTPPGRVLSPLLKIDLDAILTRRVLDDAASEVERYNALRAAIEEVEETELLMLMAVAAAEDDE